MNVALENLARVFASDAPGGYERLLGKIAEEYGETWEAWIGVLGTNPRKGVTHLTSDVREELLDVALTALIAYRNFGGEEPLDDLARHACNRWDRHLAQVPA